MILSLSSTELRASARILAVLLASSVLVFHGNEAAAGEDEPGKTENAQVRGEEELLKGKAAYSRLDYESAAKHFALAAEQGNAEAQYLLGRCYTDGTGVEIDCPAAFKWSGKAAEQGNPEAQFVLGELYGHGLGVLKDVSKAEEWYGKAFPGLKRDAENGDPEAQYFLAASFSRGYGVEKNLKEAVKWYRKAAEQGNAQAQYNLGLCYENGEGVKKDLIKAKEWYSTAAEQGYYLAGMALERLEESESESVGVSTTVQDALRDVVHPATDD